MRCAEQKPDAEAVVNGLKSWFASQLRPGRERKVVEGSVRKIQYRSVTGALGRT